MLIFILQQGETGGGEYYCVFALIGAKVALNQYISVMDKLGFFLQPSKSKKMKKIIVAACLIFATSYSFAQPRQNDPFSNDHGQNDCQCIGIGIPTPTPDAAIKNAPGNTTPHTPKSAKEEEPGIWYTFFKFYLAELSNSLHIYGRNNTQFIGVDEPLKLFSFSGFFLFDRSLQHSK